MYSARADTLRTRLERATRSYHEQAERHLALDRPSWTERQYLELLQGFWGFYAPLEVQLSGVDWLQSDMEIGPRFKAQWLKADLMTLGMTDGDVEALESAADVPALDCREAGFGALYVVEGATLGGKVILKSLQTRLGISGQTGGRFFASYGAEVGSMWRTYLTALERVGRSPGSRDVIEGAAIETFQAFDRWFRPSTISEPRGGWSPDD